MNELWRWYRKFFEGSFGGFRSSSLFMHSNKQWPKGHFFWRSHRTYFKASCLLSNSQEYSKSDGSLSKWSLRIKQKFFVYRSWSDKYLLHKQQTVHFLTLLYKSGKVNATFSLFQNDTKGFKVTIKLRALECAIVPFKKVDESFWALIFSQRGEAIDNSTVWSLSFFFRPRSRLNKMPLKPQNATPALNAFFAAAGVEIVMRKMTHWSKIFVR